MANESSARSRALFDAALAQPRHARIDFLRSVCTDDPGMLREVIELVELHDRLESEEDPDGGLIGTLVGPYRILRLLGAGGMGRVYLAARADGAFERQVAIKLVNPVAAEEDVLRRFEDECRILASLQHPHIAALLDAGRTSDHRLYFVLEYVDGLPITTYCERHRLPFESRLALMRQVSEVVAFAHRNLVVHRDLKPGNILVDSNGIPKLLDFGIAKVLTRSGLGASDATHPLLQRATPGYASPEQLRGEAPHTGMDVFALGVILHELVSNLRPIPVSADDATSTGAGGYRPPSSFVDGFAEGYPHSGEGAKDIDAVVLKALATDAQDRYASAEALVRDLDAILEDRPVSARRPTSLYRARKFTRRNRMLVALAASTVVAVLAAIASLASLWRSERTERLAAERRFEELQKLAGSFFHADTLLAGIPGTTAVRQSLSQSLTAYLDALRTAAGEDERIRLNVAEGYRRLGDVQGNPNEPHLGDTARALTSYAAAIDILRGLSAGESDSSEVLEALARTLASRGDVYTVRGEARDAAGAYQESREIVTRLSERHPDESSHPELLARLERSVGDLAMAGGDASSAAASYERALALELSLARRVGETPNRRRLLALTRLRTASARELQGDWRNAHAQYSAAVDALQELSAADGAGASLLRDTAVGLTRLASTVKGADPEAARGHLQEAIAVLRRLTEADAADVRVRRDLALALVQQGDLWLPTDAEKARSDYQEAYRVAESIGRERDSRIDEDLAMIRTRLASGPRAAQPHLRLFALADGRRVPIGPASSVPATTERLAARADAPTGWRRYLLVFGAEGGGTIFDESQLSAADWTLPLTGPPPAQTVLLLTLPRQLTTEERRALIASIARIPGPRAVDWDSHVVWSSETPDPQVLSTASARGATDRSWIAAVQSCLTLLPDARFAGLTFPIHSIRR